MVADRRARRPATIASREAGAAAAGNRYARDWNAYSRRWEATHGPEYAHLGDEWNDDGAPGRPRDAFYFLAYAERWIGPGMTVLEVGPGGGKWTVRLAEQVERLIVLDVAEEMLERTRRRCEEAGLDNVEYVLSSGRGFESIPDASVDFFFSYDVFVHLALEDTWAYAQEIARVLAPGARGACHHAINTPPEAWDRIAQTNEWYRFGAHTLGQYYYYSPAALSRMYERCGLRVLEQHHEGWHATSIFEKPAVDIVPRLESLLHRLAGPEADDPDSRARLSEAVLALSEELGTALRPHLERLRGEEERQRRGWVAAEIRRIWRGC